MRGRRQKEGEGKGRGKGMGGGSRLVLWQSKLLLLNELGLGFCWSAMLLKQLAVFIMLQLATSLPHPS